MKYKVGDEVLVKARIIRSYGKGKYITEINEDGYYKTFDCKENDIFPYPSMTAEEAWEIARRIILTERCGGLSSKEIRHIFVDVDVEDIIKDFSPQQAKTKIEAWEAEEEIKVGDEVVPKESPGDDDCKFFVTYIDDDNSEISGFSGFDGDVFFGRFLDRYQKTGRHIDIDGILKQISGGE